MIGSLTNTIIPELGDQKKGKVREVYFYQNQLVMIASDRISAFDTVLCDLIPDKGKILTQLSLFWFDKTKDIVENHLIFSPDPNILIVKKCKVIPLEIIVRNYVTGSLWKDYENNKNEKCGLKLPKNLKENQELEYPIITPTTKNDCGHDVDISKTEIIERKIVSKELLAKIEEVSLKLFERGQSILSKCNLILADTKYEFGLDQENNLVLIDEIHTPDSSRFWFKEDIEKKKYTHHSKEFLRKYLVDNDLNKKLNDLVLPTQVKEQIRERYVKIYQAITKEKLKNDSLTPRERILERLTNAKLIKGYFILVYIDENILEEHEKKIKSILSDYKIPHKTLRKPFEKHAIEAVVKEYNQSIEPMVYIFFPLRNILFFNELKSLCCWPVVLNQEISSNKSDLTLNNLKSTVMAGIRKLKNICDCQ